MAGAARAALRQQGARPSKHLLGSEVDFTTLDLGRLSLRLAVQLRQRPGWLRSAGDQTART
jgi:hypothetical protein